VGRFWGDGRPSARGVAVVRSRVVLVGGGFVLAVALLAAAAWTFGLRHEGGPLDGAAGGTVCMPAHGSKDFSHTVSAFRNEAGKGARITSVTLLGSEGLRLADAILVQRGDSGFGSTSEWPPPTSQLIWSGRVPAVGGTIPPADNLDGKYWDLVLHLQADDDRAQARFDGVRIDYRVGSRRYQLTDSFRFVVVRTEQCTPGDLEQPG
jgi:hypothetical protein